MIPMTFANFPAKKTTIPRIMSMIGFASTRNLWIESRIEERAEGIRSVAAASRT